MTYIKMLLQWLATATENIAKPSKSLNGLHAFVGVTVHVWYGTVSQLMHLATVAHE